MLRKRCHIWWLVLWACLMACNSEPVGRLPGEVSLSGPAALRPVPEPAVPPPPPVVVPKDTCPPVLQVAMRFGYCEVDRLKRRVALLRRSQAQADSAGQDPTAARLKSDLQHATRDLREAQANLAEEARNVTAQNCFCPCECD